MNELSIRDMKKIIMTMVLGALMACLVPMHAQEWKSTSTMQGAGSAYSSQVTAVGAAAAASQATTTESYSPASSGPRRIGNFGTPADTKSDDESPVGDAVLPLLALACVYMVYCASRVYRRKRNV